MSPLLARESCTPGSAVDRAQSPRLSSSILSHLGRQQPPKRNDNDRWLVLRPTSPPGEWQRLWQSAQLSLEKEDMVVVHDQKRKNCSNVPAHFKPTSTGGIDSLTLVGFSQRDVLERLTPSTNRFHLAADESDDESGDDDDKVGPRASLPLRYVHIQSTELYRSIGLRSSHFVGVDGVLGRWLVQQQQAAVVVPNTTMHTNKGCVGNRRGLRTLRITRGLHAQPQAPWDEFAACLGQTALGPTNQNNERNFTSSLEEFVMDDSADWLGFSEALEDWNCWSQPPQVPRRRSRSPAPVMKWLDASSLVDSLALHPHLTRVELLWNDSCLGRITTTALANLLQHAPHLTELALHMAVLVAPESNCHLRSELPLARALRRHSQLKRLQLTCVHFIDVLLNDDDSHRIDKDALVYQSMSTVSRASDHSHRRTQDHSSVCWDSLLAGLQANLSLRHLYLISTTLSAVQYLRLWSTLGNCSSLTHFYGSVSDLPAVMPGLKRRSSLNGPSRRVTNTRPPETVLLENAVGDGDDCAFTYSRPRKSPRRSSTDLNVRGANSSSHSKCQDSAVMTALQMEVDPIIQSHMEGSIPSLIQCWNRNSQWEHFSLPWQDSKMVNDTHPWYVSSTSPLSFLAAPLAQDEKPDLHLWSTVHKLARLYLQVHRYRRWRQRRLEEQANEQSLQSMLRYWSIGREQVPPCLSIGSGDVMHDEHCQQMQSLNDHRRMVHSPNVAMANVDREPAVKYPDSTTKAVFSFDEPKWQAYVWLQQWNDDPNCLYHFLSQFHGILGSQR